MIRLKKLTDSDAAHGRSIAWLGKQCDEYLRACGDGDGKRYESKYRDSRVKQALLVETFGKCAYCESKYAAVTWGDVEHILPKAGRPDRLLDYLNLTLVCSVCNVTKSNREFTTDGLLNPYVDYPAEYLGANGPMIMPNLADPYYVRASRTIDHVGLNRPALLEARTKAVKEKWQSIIREFRLAPNDALREYAGEQIDRLTAADAEYCRAARAFFRTHLPERPLRPLPNEPE